MLALVWSSGCAHRFGIGVDVHEVHTAHFDAYGDVGPERLSAEVNKLEMLWDVFALHFSAVDAVERARASVFIMREGEPDEFEPFSGGFVTNGLEPVVVASVPDTERTKGLDVSVNTHELVHFISAYSLTGQPRWLSEGLAELFEDATFVRPDTVRMGQWLWDPTEYVSLDALFDWSKKPVPLDQARGHYATARAVLLYLANRDEVRLNKLYQGLQRGEPYEALEASLFPPLSALTS